MNINDILNTLSSTTYTELRTLANKIARFDNFVHLHLHTTYSFLDGFNKPADSAERARELGMTAMAITDHNHLAGVLEFQAACYNEGIMPLLGCEMYHTWDADTLAKSPDDRRAIAIEKAEADGIVIDKKAKVGDIKDLIAPYEYDTKQYHILFIAKNQKGWSNLVKLQSEAAARCTYNRRYMCDTEMMRKYSEGVLMTTACIQNNVPELFIQGRDEEAICLLEEWYEIFGENFFVEIQPLSIKKQWIANVKLLKWASERNVPVVATNDVHYTRKEDHDDHDTLFVIGMGAKKDDRARMRYSNDFWIKSYDEMLESFATQIDDMDANDFKGKELYDREAYMEAVIKALDTTNDIAKGCTKIELGSSKPMFPQIDAPKGMTPEGWLIHKCYKALYKYKNANPDIELKVYERRLKEELDIINPKGFAPYMLIVEDYIEWANANECPTGPGRGSAAGSLVLFLLGVTKMIDPIKYQLLFFRFLTADRTSPPDVDTDFDYDNRHRVIEYLEHKYGHEKVSHIGTFSYIGVKSGLKDVGRVLEIDFNAMNVITKKIDEILDKPSVKFKHFDALKDGDANERSKWKEFNELEESQPELFRLARRFEGIARQTGVHASGILITPMAINDIIPTRKAKDGTTVTLYTGVQLEDLGFIKFDILGLKTISVLKNTLKSINENLTFDDLYDEVSLTDEGMYSMIREKKTEGLFQIESNLFKGMIEEIQPDNFNDIVVMNALGRPGPLSAGMPAAYARRKAGTEIATEPLPNTFDITENTLGTIAYQEQLMLIAQRVAGFNGNQADSYLRKATAKKDKKKMAICKQWFVFGKLNEAAPEDHNPDDMNQPMYDPEGKHGTAVAGGIAKGYDRKQLEKFWSDIEGYCDYLFNLSHSACYSYITALTSYLKKYYPTEFMAALLSSEEDEEKTAKYIGATEALGIKVSPPNINLSNEHYTPIGNTILFGLGSIKGVGETSVPTLIEKRPYLSIQDMVERLPKKQFNKRVGVALIKSGALDTFNSNRHAVLNAYHDIRKDKDDRYDEEMYNEDACMTFEQTVLGAPVTYKPWWETIPANTSIAETFELVACAEKADRNGRLMGFITLRKGGTTIKALAFASSYGKCAAAFDAERVNRVFVKGKKDDKGTLLISSGKAQREEPVLTAQFDGLLA